MNPELKEAKQKVLEHLRRNNIPFNSVSIGYKKVGEIYTGKQCVVVGVPAKLEKALVPVGKLIPKEIQVGGGFLVDTDVIEVPEIKALALTDPINPTPGGYSIGHFKITAGTLGMWVRKNGEWCILSNNHVIANSNDAEIGDRILHPGPSDTMNRVLGFLSEFIPIKFEDTPPDVDCFTKCREEGDFFSILLCWLGCILKNSETEMRIEKDSVVINLSRPQTKRVAEPNLVDAALALASSNTLVDPVIAIINTEPKGITNVDLGDKVKKVGRTTELTTGRVSDLEATIRVNYGSGRMALFEDQIGFEPDSFSRPGDSGSVILTEDKLSTVALLFAGGGGKTFGNPMSHVQQKLGFTFE